MGVVIADSVDSLVDNRNVHGRSCWQTPIKMQSNVGKTDKIPYFCIGKTDKITLKRVGKTDKI